MKQQHLLRALTAMMLAIHLGVFSPAVSAYSQIVPKGTLLKLTLKTNLNTKTNKVGDPFVADLAEPVRVDSNTVLPVGSQVTGSIARMEEARRMGGLTGKASMVLRFEQVQTPSGQQPIAATLISIHDPLEGSKQSEKVKEEGEVEAKTDAKEMATKGAIGVAAGTVLGAVFGNISRGLLLGSIGGAVAILAPKGKDVALPEGTGMQIRLDRELEVK